jgi:hypothetical protein
MFLDLETNSTCESICSVHELEHEHELEHGDNTLYSTTATTQSISAASPELVAQVSRLEALLSNPNTELRNINNNDHDSHSYYGSEGYYGFENEDDSLANELEQLTESEEALRRELEQYQSYSLVSTLISALIQEDHGGSKHTDEELLEAAQVESDCSGCSEQPIAADTSVAARAMHKMGVLASRPDPVTKATGPVESISAAQRSAALPLHVAFSSPDGTHSDTTCGTRELSLSSCQSQGQDRDHHSYLPSSPVQEELSSLHPVKQEPFQRDGATATAATTTSSPDLAADCHAEPCSDSSDSDSMLYSLLSQEDLATIPEQTPVNLSSATRRVAVQGGWDWEYMPLERDDSTASDVDADVDTNGGNDYLEDFCLSDQQVGDETDQAESLRNGGCAALAQAVVPAKRVALLGGGEWEMMRKGDSLFLLADDSDSSSDPLDNKEIEQEKVLAQPVPAKRAAVLGGGQWEMMRNSDFFLNDDSDSSLDQLGNDNEKSIGGMHVTALAQPLPAKRAAVLGGGQWEMSLEDDLMDDSDSSLSWDPLNEQAEGVVEAIHPPAQAKGRSDNVAAIPKTEHHQWGHSRIVSCFVIYFITTTVLSKAYGSAVEVTFVSKAQPLDEMDAIPLQVEGATVLETSSRCLERDAHHRSNNARNTSSKPQEKQSSRKRKPISLVSKEAVTVGTSQTTTPNKRPSTFQRVMQAQKQQLVMDWNDTPKADDSLPRRLLRSRHVVVCGSVLVCFAFLSSRP